MATTWLEVARDARHAAAALVTEDRHRSAASRAYYAAYSKIAHELVVTAGLQMARGREGPSHGSLRRLIESSMPHMAQDKRERLSEMVGRFYTLRIDADYRPSTEFDGRDAREAFSIMKTILEAF